jgi:DNA-directed RNA polymerase subunit K/omega
MNSAMSKNKFLKVLITAQRARQLHKGAHPLVQDQGRRATRVALDEVERGLIDFEFVDLPAGLNPGRENRDGGPRIANKADRSDYQVIAAKSGE